MKTNELTKGQIAVLIGATIPMLVFGFLGGWGTYTNIASVFDRDATALGVVAAGEGATFVLALVMLSAVMLGRPSPKTVRVGLWLLPMAAAVVSASTAPGLVEGIVFGVTPLGMVVSAEGLGFLARMIVVYRTGVDTEALRKNAEIMQRLAYHNARSKNHPDEDKRKASARKAWKLAKKVGQGDAVLGSSLVDVQRVRMNEGADNGLVQMFGLSVPELSQGQDTPETETVSEDKDTQDTHAGQDKPKAVRKTPGQKKYSARDYFRDVLLEDTELVVSQAFEKAQEKFPEITEANARKAFNRARADLGLN
jgi:hypothetical protein